MQYCNGQTLHIWVNGHDLGPAADLPAKVKLKLICVLLYTINRVCCMQLLMFMDKLKV